MSEVDSAYIPLQHCGGTAEEPITTHLPLLVHISAHGTLALQLPSIGICNDVSWSAYLGLREKMWARVELNDTAWTFD